MSDDLRPEAVKALRQRLGLAIRAFAALIPVASHKTVQRWELPRDHPQGNEPKGLYATRLHQLFRVSIPRSICRPSKRSRP